ncbi:Carboxypeptidase S [Grifola frondosa]|uniref:Carboxypeptidase S n=1 Tax=Grifola frondosa TaxID=5627 RepID=A0A1C7MBI0_GRIFR|nr:Carboxypeptidase S [Grifola frondosa]
MKHFSFVLNSRIIRMESIRVDKVLPLTSNWQTATQSYNKSRWEIIRPRLFFLLFLFLISYNAVCHFSNVSRDDSDFSEFFPVSPSRNSDACPQVGPLKPSNHSQLASELDALYSTDTIKLAAYVILGSAVQIPTESYDDLAPVGQDPRWGVFSMLHQFLESTFPTTYATLNVTRVNTYGLVFHWQGSDPSIKPVLMTAHQDVVPVDPSTVDQWLHPPFSGTWIWGRGSCDDKSDLIAVQRIAIDAMIKQGFSPRRTFVLAFGIDEEASGLEGAGHLAQYLESTYGTDGFAMLLDEGGNTPFGPDVIFAMPSLSEKGYFDARIEISAPGGHSSVPPAHTAIGMLSSMLVAIEANPHVPELARSGTAFAMTQCTASYAPEYPNYLRQLAQEAVHNDAALERLKEGLLASYPLYTAILSTTQAVDLIQGGVKVNALPERVSAVVNHRIAEHSSVKELQKHLIDTVLPIAIKYDLSVDAFGTNISAGSGGAGHVVLSDSWGTALEPSPVTPAGLHDPYQLLAGTIKATLMSSATYNASGVVVAPMLSLGNTDTQFYWNLTKHIFRYTHGRDTDQYNGLHTINEGE